MPQFDFYSWSSVCFWTLFFFQLMYFFLLHELFIPLCEFDKFYSKFLLKLNKDTLTKNMSNYFYKKFC